MTHVFADGILNWCREAESITILVPFGKEIIRQISNINFCLYVSVAVLVFSAAFDL